MQKLMNKRDEIDNLKQFLMGIMHHSTSKKIDIDELKRGLAESVRRDKYSHPFNPNT